MICSINLYIYRVNLSEISIADNTFLCFRMMALGLIFHDALNMNLEKKNKFLDYAPESLAIVLMDFCTKNVIFFATQVNGSILYVHRMEHGSHILPALEI